MHVSRVTPREHRSWCTSYASQQNKEVKRKNLGLSSLFLSCRSIEPMFAIFWSDLSFPRFSWHAVSNHSRFRSSRSCAFTIVHTPVEIVCFIIFTGNCTATLNSYCQPSAATCLSLCLVELVHRRRRRKATCASPRKFMSCSRCSTKC